VVRAVAARQDPEVASVASLLEAARSALQEEAVRFVLAVLVMRSLDPKEKTHRETVSNQLSACALNRLVPSPWADPVT
jgi:hypothetical protein